MKTIAVEVTRSVYYDGKMTVVGERLRLPEAHAKFLEAALAVKRVRESRKSAGEQ